jgi:enamine deaminase RidA (YjgF/YER057c/UK114 family)
VSSPSDRLAKAGLRLPPVAAPVAAYVPAVRHDDLVWTSGQLPLVDGNLPVTGRVGGDVTEQQAYELARICALNALAAGADIVGSLDHLVRVVKVVGFVASDPGFFAQPKVVNGASELLGEIFADAGRHARSAVGVAALPMNSPVEVEVVFSVAA